MTTPSQISEPLTFRKIVDAQINADDKQRLLSAIKNKQSLHFTGRGLGKSTLARFIKILDDEKNTSTLSEGISVFYKTQILYVDESCNFPRFTPLALNRTIFESYKLIPRLAKAIPTSLIPTFEFHHFIPSESQDRDIRSKLWAEKDEFLQWIDSQLNNHMDCDE